MKKKLNRGEREEVFKPYIQKFVASYGGLFDKHCSEEALAALLLWRLCRSPDYGDKSESRAYLILFDKDNCNLAYEAAQPIFETVFEHKLKTGGNGHHKAQEFEKAMNLAREEIIKEFGEQGKI